MTQAGQQYRPPNRAIDPLDGLPGTINRLPARGGAPRVGVHACLALILLLGVYLAFTNVLAHQGHRTVEFAKPALSSVTWAEQVDAFSGKLKAAFGLESAVAEEFSGWILEAADRQRLDPKLIASLVYVESSFRKNVRSWAGAIGPVQVKPRYWRAFCGGDDLTDPRRNIHCGAQVLAHLSELCGGNECALGTYNIGMNSSQRHAARRYVAKIDHHYLQLKTL